MSAVRAVPGADESAEQGAESECGHRDQGCGDREARGTGEGKAKEDDVAREFATKTCPRVR